MHALVAGAAPEPGGQSFYRSLLRHAEIVVAADAAAEWCVSLGRVPDVAVGDFDSAEAGAVERLEALGVHVARHPAEKDASDLDLALAEARDAGATRVTLTAASTGRLDHTLAALGTLAAAADLLGELAEPSVAAWVLDAASRPTIELTGPPGALVSVFAFGGTVAGVQLAGLRYALRAAELGSMSSRGLSNELTRESATISLAAGRLLVVTPGRQGARAVCVQSH